MSLSSPLSLLTKGVLRLGPGALKDDAASRANGILLLLTALAMAALAVSSFTLMRRLRRFRGEPR